jgi:hypothetical protein
MPTRAELETAFENYQATVRQAKATNDWTLFAGLFTAMPGTTSTPTAGSKGARRSRSGSCAR